MKREELIEELARAMRLADIGEALEASSPEERAAFEAAWFTTDQWIRDKWLRPAAAVLARLEALQLAVVPKEPTPEMLHAATMEVPTWDDDASRRKYRAMLAASVP